MTGEEKLLQKMQEGWNINIECKGKGRNYSLTYEATAYETGQPNCFNNILTSRHAIGNTLSELICNLFDNHEEYLKSFYKIEE